MFLTPLLQIEAIPEQGGALGLPSVGDIVSSPYVTTALVLLGILIAVWTVVLVIRRMYMVRGSARRAFNMAVLLVKVPKETKKEDASGEKSSQQIQEMIAVMETIFSTLGSLTSQTGVRSWLFGRTDHFSYEIVFHQNRISFFVATPLENRNFIEEQIHAQYPHAEIEEVPDYNIFTPTGVVMGSYIKLRRSSVFSVKTYKKLETDPLNSLTNSLSKFEEGDGAAIQFVVRSAPRAWRR